MEDLNKLLEDMDKFYNIDHDPRYRGMHPKCDEILDQLEDEFLKMDEDDLRELLDGMNDDQLEQVTGALMGLDYDWVIEYEKL